jgi:hypothetical protein
MNTKVQPPCTILRIGGGTRRRQTYKNDMDMAKTCQKDVPLQFESVAE